MSLPAHTGEPRLATVLLIGALASVCALVLPSIGLGAAWQEALLRHSHEQGVDLRVVPSTLVALIAIAAAFATAWMIETAPTLTQKCLLWVSAFIVFNGWMIVTWMWGWLLPPSHLPIAVAWSGVCSLIRAYQLRRSDAKSAHSTTQRPS